MTINMRLYKTILFSLLWLLSVTAAAQEKRYSADFDQTPIEQVIRDLRQQTGYEFVYQREVVKNIQPVTRRLHDVTLHELLDQVIRMDAGLDYEIVKQSIVLKRPEPRAQTGRNAVSGVVVDEKGDPMPYVTVKVKGTDRGVITDQAGKFSISLDRLDVAVVEFSYLGFKTVSRTYHPVKPTKSQRIVMHEDESTLGEVVVTGYQVLDKRSLTSAVSSAKMEDLHRADMSSLDQMLEGRIPDLMVTNNSAEVGVAPKIRIRGTSTLVGNREPLWVVDGIVVKDPVQISPEELNDPDYVNRIGNAIAGINPQDIERIDVLKDAAATAIYGTKAANGVIVVTTKRGSEGKPIVSYNVNATTKLRPHYSDRSVDVMSSKERIQFSRELARDHYHYYNTATLVGYELLLSQLYNRQISYDQFVEGVSQAEQNNTDWFGLLTNNSWSQQHTASISGGSQVSRYYASIGYTADDDVVKWNNNRRITYSINLDNTFSKLLSASFTFNGYHSTRDYYQDEIAPMQYAYTTSRAIPAFTPDGHYSYYKRRVTRWTEYNYNILNELDNSYKQQEVNSMTFTANLKFSFTDWLHANAILSINHQNTDQEGWWGETTNHVASLRGTEYGATMTVGDKYDSQCPQGGELSKAVYRDNNMTARLQIDANKYFGEDGCHNIDGTFGLEMNHDTYMGHSTKQRGYYKDRGESFVTNIDLEEYVSYGTWLAGNVPFITDNLTNTISAYASLTYAYKRLWRVNINGRVDGSNKFGDRSNERFLPIWSVSGSYDLSSFLSNVHWIDYTTLKASYGFQGNMLDTESPAMTIRKSPMDSYYNEFTSTVVNHPNPDLKWEKTRSYNLGLDMAFFDHRLAVEASLYYKKTVDAFMSKRVSTVNGVSSYVINGGDVTNKGYSVDISATPFRTKNFRWTLSTNISKVFNTVDSKPDAQTYDLGNFLRGTAIIEGKAVNTFYSYRFLGLSPIDGGPLIDDFFDNTTALQGLSKYDTYTTVLSASGKREADLQGSLTNTFRYKQWHASLSLGYSLGAKTRLFAMFGSAASEGVYNSTIYPEKNYSRDYLDRWQFPGDEQHTNIPALVDYYDTDGYKYTSVWTSKSSAGNVYTIGNSYYDMYDYSDVRVVPADYLKLQSVSVTYEVPHRLLDRLGLQRIALTVSAYNLFTLADPALKGQTPTQGGFSTIELSDRPSFSMGLNVQF